jgi:hypothetical protein
VGHRSLRNDSITWSVATATWVAPSSNMESTEPGHAAGGGHLPTVGGHVRRQGEVVAEQLVGAVDQVDVHVQPWTGSSPMGMTRTVPSGFTSVTVGATKLDR